jgi:hypothetical protein
MMVVEETVSERPGQIPCLTWDLQQRERRGMPWSRKALESGFYVGRNLS